MDARLDIDQDEFQARKKRRIEEVQARPLRKSQSHVIFFCEILHPERPTSPS